jgi:threonyl-tRNA synthetase
MPNKTIKITLKNGDVLEKNIPITLSQLCREIGKKLFEDAVAAKVNGKLRDLRDKLEEDAEVVFITSKDPEALPIFRHSAAHIMAQAVKRLFPGTKLAIGPAIENGFYYDFDTQGRLTPETLEKVEAEMKKIVEADYPFSYEDVPKDQALDYFRKQDEPFKVELIQEIPEATARIYTQGEFSDLCRGPHLPSTGRLKAFKLLSVAGAYWRGSEKNPMLQRLYGTAFPTQKELDEHLKKLEEAAKRDHRKLGKELDLFSIHDLTGPGLILWHPKGGMIRKIVEDYWREEHLKRGYQLVYTPHIARVDLWKTSGHWDFYRDNMYKPIEVEEQEFMLKPMNCPFHILIYKNRKRSYRELPIRYGELGTVYRYERSGVLHGLMRVRGFTQDDAHIFCTEEQLEGEMEGCVRLALDLLKRFEFREFVITLSTGPYPSKAWELGLSPENLYKRLIGETSESNHKSAVEKKLTYHDIVERFFPEKKNEFAGEPEKWVYAEEVVARVLEKVVIPEGIQPEIDVLGAAFYGPKIDIKVKDALGREWQCSTIQFDFNLPSEKRFDVRYTGADGKEHTAYMVHRAMLGSFERFFGCLIEHYAGAFPLWLAPLQIKLLPIMEKHLEYAKKIEAQLQKAGFRVEIDARSEKIGAKIRDAQLEKIPYMLILGDKELESQTVSVRERKSGDLGSMPFQAFMEKLRLELPQ